MDIFVRKASEDDAPDKEIVSDEEAVPGEDDALSKYVASSEDVAFRSKREGIPLSVIYFCNEGSRPSPISLLVINDKKTAPIIKKIRKVKAPLDFII